MRYLLLFLTFSITYGAYSASTLDEKVAVLFEVSPNEMRQEALTAELHLFCNELKSYNDLAPKKKIKKIFSIVKKRYLHHYSLYSFFPEIKSGTYNCVTGSALFAIIFDELGIPYIGIEVPQHVYLIAYPDDLKIGVESTDLKNGIYYWSEYNKIKAVNYLITIGKVKESEVMIRGVDAIIEEFFFARDELDFDNLSGLHFFNRALYYSEKKENEKALLFSKRACELYENERNTYLLGGILLDLVEETEMDNILIVDYITQYYNIAGKKAEKDRILGNFKYVYQEALKTRRDFEFTDSTVSLIQTNLEDPQDKNAFLGAVELVNVHWHATRKEIRKAFEAAKRGYQYSPENYQFQDFISSLIIEVTFAEDLNERNFVDSLEAYEQQFPFLIENQTYNEVIAMFYAFGISDTFLSDDAEFGYLLLDRLSPVLDRLDLNDNDELRIEIAEAYSQIATYHYRAKDYQKAGEWIDKAVNLDPENEWIKRKQDYIGKKL